MEGESPGGGCKIVWRVRALVVNVRLCGGGGESPCDGCKFMWTVRMVAHARHIDTKT